MASSGPNIVGTGANDATVGTVAWSNPGNITANDGSNASVSISTNATVSNYIKGTNLGFAIPAGATIDGIVVEIERYGDDFFGTLFWNDDQARIIKSDGSIGSVNKASGNWAYTATLDSYGSSSDLWGETWTASDINNSNFGFVSAVRKTMGFTHADSAYVDYMQITVYYTAAAGAMTQQSVSQPMRTLLTM